MYNGEGTNIVLISMPTATERLCLSDLSMLFKYVSFDLLHITQ